MCVYTYLFYFICWFLSLNAPLSRVSSSVRLWPLHKGCEVRGIRGRLSFLGATSTYGMMKS